MRTFVLFLLAFPSKTSKWNKIHHPSTQAVFVFHALLITFLIVKADYHSSYSLWISPTNDSQEPKNTSKKRKYLKMMKTIPNLKIGRI